MIKFSVKDVFWSIQGEGARVGTVSVFVRFGGCNLRCSFCDTDFLTHLKNYSIEELVEQTNTVSHGTRSLILTGGEPLIWKTELPNFLTALKKQDGRWYVAIETNGTIGINATLKKQIDWVCCSPKKIDKIKIRRADEVKVVFTEEYREWIKEIPKIINAKHYFLSPEALPNNPFTATRSSGNYLEETWGNLIELLDFIKENPEWKLNLQIHKIIKLP